MELLKISLNVDYFFKGIFLIFLTLIGNFLSTSMPCKLQKLLSENIYVKNISLFILIYFTIDVFKDNSIKYHPLEILKSTFLIFISYILFTKQNLFTSVIIIILLIIQYILYNANAYYKDKVKDNNLNLDYDIKKNIKIIDNTYNYILILITIIMILGFINYYIMQKKNYKNNFKISKFLLGVVNCKSL